MIVFKFPVIVDRRDGVQSLLYTKVQDSSENYNVADGDYLRWDSVELAVNMVIRDGKTGRVLEVFLDMLDYAEYDTLDEVDKAHCELHDRLMKDNWNLV